MLCVLIIKANNDCTSHLIEIGHKDALITQLSRRRRNAPKWRTKKFNKKKLLGMLLPLPLPLLLLVLLLLLPLSVSFMAAHI